MSDWSHPINTDPYADYTGYFNARLNDLAVGNEPIIVTLTNQPTGTQRWNASLAKWQLWSGAAWGDLAAVYAISISGNAATASAVPWSGITSKPTTVAGYAISDALTAASLVWTSISGRPTVVSAFTNDAGYVTGSTGGQVRGGATKLVLTAGGTSPSISVQCDEISLEDASHNYVTVRNVSCSLNTAAVGANGQDSATAVAASTWYSVWVIWNGTTVATLASLSASTPTLPSGYTHSARIGWLRTDATANKYPLGMRWTGSKARYIVNSASNLTALPQICSGVIGNASTPTWVATSLASVIPSTARSVELIAICSGHTILAESNYYGGYTSTTNPPPFTSNGTAYSATPVEIAMWGVNFIYYATDNAADQLRCYGWDDNL